jgi:hypothetical protein
MNAADRFGTALGAGLSLHRARPLRLPLKDSPPEATLGVRLGNVPPEKSVV